jgi:chlorobactene glucosyltransferase
MMITSLVLSGVVLLIAWMWLQLAKREVSLPIWSALEIPELAEEASPFVSIVVPVHGDGPSLDRCVQSLLRQDYPGYEVIIVAVHAGAGMGERLRAMQASAEVPVRVIQGEGSSLERQHQVAAQQGLQHARGEWLLVTTADTYHAPTLLSRAMAYARLQGLGMLSLAPRYECRTFWEHVWHPVALHYLDLVMPMARVGEARVRGVWSCEAFVLVSREAYAKAESAEAASSEGYFQGGLMRRVKALGYRVAFVKAADLIQARPYRTLRELWTGWGQRLYILLGARPLRVAIHGLVIWLWTVLPFAALVPAFSFGFWGLDAVQGWWDVVLAVSAILAVVTVLQAQSVLRRVQRQNHFYTATLALAGFCLGAATLWSLAPGMGGKGGAAAKELGAQKRGDT